MSGKGIIPGRNDPCDCESGKKYKYCCLPEDRRMLANNSASAGPIETLPTLQPIANELERLKSPSDMPRRAALCRRALKLISRKRYPDSWASIQNELGRSLLQNLSGVHQAENLELAIAAFQQALEVYTRQDWPVQWGQTMNTLGLAYHNRIRGNKAENMEQAIDILQQARQVLSPETTPVDWVQTTMNLGDAYRDRIKGNRAKNLEQAISLHKQAMNTANIIEDRFTGAKISVNLGIAYANQIYGDRTENIESAIVAFEQALLVITCETMPVEWAEIHVNLALAYSDRLIGDQMENIGTTICHYQQALKVITRDAMPAKWAQTMSNLAAAYTERCASEPSDDLELAIAACKNALQIRTRETTPIEWAKTTINLANAYFKRVQDDPAKNLYKAIGYYHQALEVVTQESLPLTWADIMHNLAKIHQKLIPIDRADNPEQAIHYFESALKVRLPELYPAGHRKTQQSLGDLYFNEQDWQNAYTAYTHAIEAGNILFAAAYTEAGRRAEISQTARLYAGSAYCLLKLGEFDEALCQLEKGKTRLLAQVLAMSNVDQKILSKSQQQALSDLRDEIRSLEAEMRLPSDTPARRDNRELAEALRLKRTELNDLLETIRGDHPEFMLVSLEISEILALVPTNGALIAPLITPQGSAVFVIPHGIDTITAEHVIWLDEFTGNDLSNLLVGDSDNHGWLLAYLNIQDGGSGEEWIAAIEKILGQLWQSLMGPIYDHLQASQLIEGADVVLMPHSGLNYLPLHAAWREVNGVKRSFLDDYIVAYTPSAYSLRTCQSRLQLKDDLHRSLLAVINPTNDLDNASIEGESVVNLFGRDASQTLTRTEATRLAVIQSAPGKSHLHFACHGQYDWHQAMQSGLLLGNREMLTLSEVIATLNLEAVRLVTLSACETGLTDIWQSLEEHVGLPTGFLQAGTPAVVSTLWAVDDMSTMLLMERFYHGYLNEGLDICEALRQAQLWLRDVSAQELTNRIPKGTTHYRHFSRDFKADERPFAHPYYWAAFTFSGV